MSRSPNPPADLVALLDLAVESLEAIDGASDRRAQFRTALQLANDLVERVRGIEAADLPERFAERAVDAHHCLNMGKPRECLAMFRMLQHELSGFWTE